MSDPAFENLSDVTEGRSAPPLRPQSPTLDPVPGRDELAFYVTADIPALVKGLVSFSMSLQNKTALQTGRTPSMVTSVLNRRRRAARQWLEAVAAGRCDQETLGTLPKTWGPALAGTGPGPRAAVTTTRKCLDYIHGACTALIFDAPDENLVPRAKALIALETTLSAHLHSVMQLTQTSSVRIES